LVSCLFRVREKSATALKIQNVGLKNR